MLARLNNPKQLLGNLNPQEKLDIIETLLNNSQIFTRGSSQYHVPLEISDKYFQGMTEKETLYSLLTSCRIQAMGYRDDSKLNHDDEDLQHSTSGGNAVGNIFYHTLTALLFRE